MQIHLAEISECDGKTEKYSLPFEMPAVTYQGSSYEVADSTPIELTIENTGNHVLKIYGKTDITVILPCDRCLEDVHTVIPLTFEQKLDMKQTAEDRIKDLDESSYLNGTDLDMDRMVYLELLMNWPHKILCKEDCKGLCATCGKNLNFGKCGCKEEPKDPRMAAISDIFSKFKEV